MKEFEIWSEGYVPLIAKDQAVKAKLIGKATGETFIEACENFRYPEDALNKWDQVVSFKGQSLPLHRNQDQTLKLIDGQPVAFMCRLFDNEADARRSCG